MRVNIYAEEMTNNVEIVEKTTEDGYFHRVAVLAPPAGHATRMGRSHKGHSCTDQGTMTAPPLRFGAKSLCMKCWCKPSRCWTITSGIKTHAAQQ